MFRRNNPDIDTGALADHYRESHRTHAAAEAVAGTSPHPHVDDLITDSPAACVRRGYRALLGREPTAAEQSRHQHAIETGGSRLLFLLRLRLGREARARGVRLRGVGGRLLHGAGLRLRRLPPLPAFLRAGAQLRRRARLPGEVDRLRRENAELRQSLYRLQTHVQAHLQATPPQAASVHGPGPSTTASQAAGSLPATPAAAPPTIDPALYLRFEDRFRGSEASVAARQRELLPTIQAARAGWPGRPLLDLGSGRGEWLGLLAEAGLEASGVDASPAMVTRAHAAGHAVRQDDALSALAATPAASLGAVTAFHLVEHLAWSELCQLLGEARRALAPDGLLLLETPDPDNLTVGAATFWLDPTHRRPLPAQLLAFLAEEHGFVRVRIERCHPDDPDEYPAPADAFAETVAHRLHGPRDYRLIAWTPPA